MSFMELFGGWVIGIGVTLFVALILWLGYLSSEAHEAKRVAFMTECQQDHKEYECTAMWRAGEPDTIPVFIPIPIPTGR